MAETFRVRRERSSFARAMTLKRACATLALMAGAALLVFTHAPVVRLDAPDAFAIKDAQIVTGAGKTIAKGTIVFRRGLITDVGENVKIPADARVIDGAGMTVYPGLIDGYTSLGLAAPAQAQAAGGAGGGGGRQAAVAAAAAGAQPSPETRLGDPSLAAADQVKPGTSFEDPRSVGVTTALSSPRQGIFPGQSALINLAGEEASKLVVRAPIALTVQFSSGGGFGGGYPGSLMGTVAYIRQSFYDAIRYRDEVDRYNRIKRGVPRPEHDKRLAALQPALRGELPVLFVANSDGDIRRALMIADEFKLKPMIAGAMYGYRVADLLKTRKVPVILSVDFPKRPADLPDDEDETLRALRQRAETPKGAARLAQAGVKFAFTSGSLRPQDFIANVEKAVENGLSKDEAVRALTINAAEMFGAADQLGTIEVGKIANLVVVSGDLLAKDTKVRHVFIDGDQIELKKPDAAPVRGGGMGGRPGGPPSGPAVDPSGTWSLVVQSPQGDIGAQLTLTKDGEQIAGTLGTHMGNVAIKTGRVTGNQIRLTATVDMGGESVDAIISGTIEGDSMRGTIVMGAMGSFEFTGTRAR
ncbi:MAG TPA: amidohydrolase family protein [Blastocatellia bacterium]|nr:amidohydrolase family protein [Blastocatellia bacterium]